MSEKSPSKPLSGWLILHKDVGLSSAQAVGRVRRIFGGVKTGHAGTLDPLASGILPIALGEATKTINYVMTAEKTYRFSLKWGAETQTDDVEGEITRTSAHIPSKAEIEQNLDAFRGEILQIPPDYSAVKIGGKRAYALARKRDKKSQDARLSEDKAANEQVQLTPRKISVYAFELLSCDDKGASFHVHCGKGAYIRALARDLGRKCGSAAHVTELERLSVGRFSQENAISLDILQQLADDGAALKALVDVKTVLDDIPALALTPDQAQKLRFGQHVDCSDISADGEVMLGCCDEQPVAILRIEQGRMVPQRVFNL